jgi:hypothetical protein
MVDLDAGLVAAVLGADGVAGEDQLAEPLPGVAVATGGGAAPVPFVLPVVGGAAPGAARRAGTAGFATTGGDHVCLAGDR